MAETSQESTAAAAISVHRGGGILAEGRWRRGGVVASAASTNRVDCAALHLLLAGTLAGEFIIEREGFLLGCQVDVPRATSAAAELGAGLREAIMEVRGRAGGAVAIRGLRGLEGVAGAATAGTDVGAGSWVRFGDGV